MSTARVRDSGIWTVDALRAVLRTPLLLGRAGMFPRSPVSAVRSLRVFRHGGGHSGLVALNAALNPRGAAVVDEAGGITFAELGRRTERIATDLRERAAERRSKTVAVMCRNHRGLVEALVAGAHGGLRVMLINYELSASQLGQILNRGKPGVLVYDAEFEGRLAGAVPEAGRVCADGAAEEPGSLASAAATGRSSPPVRGGGGIVLLTSGTTGLPKDVRRTPSLLERLAAVGELTTLLDRSAIRAREPVLVAPPAFHAFGLGGITLGLGLGGGVVLQRRFDAEASLAAIERHRVGTAMFVPTMLKRILDLPEAVWRRYDISSARTIINAGAPLPVGVYRDFTARYGEVLHNLYGTTEAGFGAFASPDDLRQAPGTIGRPPDGIPVRVLGPNGQLLPPGTVGRLHVGVSRSRSEASERLAKTTDPPLQNTGDLAHTDEAGRLFVDGRQDEMIISGGENIFPEEVEAALRACDGVEDAAVAGVLDEVFGQRVCAFVVRSADAQVSADELTAHLRGRLERYKAPREFVFIDEIPRSPAGKVLRGALVEDLS